MSETDFETVPVGTLAKLERMREALGLAQKSLAMLTEPSAIRSTSVYSAWVQAVEAERKARAALEDTK